MSPRRETRPRRTQGKKRLLTLHAVFTPKYRRKVFNSTVLTRCEEVMRRVCTDFGAEQREFNGETEQVPVGRTLLIPCKVRLKSSCGAP